MKKILDILPDGFRRRSLGVALALFARAVLNFAGLAVLLPLLTLVLDPAAFAGGGPLAALFERSGIASQRLFAGIICGGIVLFTLLKAATVFQLARVENRYLLDLYGALARRRYIESHDRGLAFIEVSDPAALTREVNVITRIFVFGVMRPLAAITAEALLLLLLLGTLAVYAPRAALLALAIFLPAGWLYARCVRRRIARYGAAEERVRREKGRIVGETFRGYADIELNGAFPEMLRAFDRLSDEELRIRSREADLNRLPPLLVESALALGLAGLAVGSFGGENPALWFGVSAVALLRLMPSVRGILSGWVSVRCNRYTLDRLQRPATAAPAVDGGDHPDTAARAESKVLPFERTIEVQGVAFRYPGCGQEVLHGLDFTFRKGDRIGIRGASGIGKSTLFRLLTGLYAPTQGEIRIDGVPLTATNRQAWQRRIGFVAQHVFLRDATLAENIAPGVPSAEIDRRRIAELLRIVQLEEFVGTLPRGIDTPLGACGGRLSGGQRQRVAIARALYRGADVLFFDEATASLDPRTEEGVLRSLTEFAGRNPRITLFIIAHNERSLAGCRRIIELGNSNRTLWNTSLPIFGSRSRIH